MGDDSTPGRGIRDMVRPSLSPRLRTCDSLALINDPRFPSSRYFPSTDVYVVVEIYLPRSASVRQTLCCVCCWWGSAQNMLKDTKPTSHFSTSTDVRCLCSESEMHKLLTPARDRMLIQVHEYFAFAFSLKSQPSSIERELRGITFGRLHPPSMPNASL